VHDFHIFGKHKNDQYKPSDDDLNNIYRILEPIEVIKKNLAWF
jgi:hypothetical protein